jgi:type III secretion control protein HpaP
MASTPKVPYCNLKVHTGAAPVPAPALPTPPARARFADLLKRRPSAAAPRPARPAQPPPAPPSLQPLQPLAESPELEAVLEVTAAPNEDDAVHAIEPVLDLVPADMPASVADALRVGDSHAADHAIAQYLARTVLDFCNDGAVRGGDGWQVSMPLRGDLLLATTMHLSLSRHWLLLRFVSHDERARCLVLMHQKSLQTMLQETLEPKREVAITFD